MAFVSCTLVPEGCSADRELRGFKSVRTYSLPYRIQVSGADSVGQVLTYAIAQTPAAMPDDTRARRKKIRVEMLKNGPRPFWSAVCDYSSETERSASPLWPETAAKLSGNFESKEVAVDKDLDDKALHNTAFDAYDPPITEEKGIPVIQIQVNLPRGEFHPNWARTYYRATNDAPFLGWPIETVLVVDVSWSEETYTDDDDVDVDYYTVTIKLAFDEDGWQPEVLSRGFRELDDDGNKKQITIKGREVTNPVPLDVSGKALLGDDVDSAHFEKYKLKNKRDLSALEVFF